MLCLSLVRIQQWFLAAAHVPILVERQQQNESSYIFMLCLLLQALLLSWGICRQQLGPNVMCSVQETRSLFLCVTEYIETQGRCLAPCLFHPPSCPSNISHQLSPVSLPCPGKRFRLRIFLAYLPTPTLPVYLRLQSLLTAPMSQFPIQSFYQKQYESLLHEGKWQTSFKSVT